MAIICEPETGKTRKMDKQGEKVKEDKRRESEIKS